MKEGQTEVHNGEIVGPKFRARGLTADAGSD